MNKNQLATFGAGCFWHVEDEFMKTKGVVLTKVGYEGGNTKNPTYEEVCTGETEHVEVVQLEFDPKIIDYDKLLDKFFKMHNPTSLDRQGPDIGTQYKSIIFYHNQEQKKSAEDFIKKYGALKIHQSRKIVTELRKASEFYPAEEYHQKYLKKKGAKACNIL